jgi:hypothetical protein
MNSKVHVSLIAVAVALGCDARLVVDDTTGVGGGTTGVGGGAGSGGQKAVSASYETNPRPDDCVAPPLWVEGTTQDGTLACWPLLESDETITLHVRTRTETTLSGAIVFGNGQLPAPASDGLHAYWPREKYEPGYPYGSWDNLRIANVWGGYALSVRAASVEGTRVRFSVTPAEQWRSWCELLAGYSNGLCVPSTRADGFGGTTCGDVWTCQERCDIDGVRYDCGKFALCTGAFHGTDQAFCTCAGSCCTASTEASKLSFDLHLSGSELNGSVTADEQTYLVYLTLSP